MTPLLCACAVVITLETQKGRKRAPRSAEFNFFTNCDRQKRFSQNERRRADLQIVASDFLIFAWGLSYGLSKFSDDFTPFFRLWKTIRAQWLISLFLVLRAHWFSAPGEKKKTSTVSIEGSLETASRPPFKAAVVVAGSCFIFTPTWLIIRDACRHVFRMLQLASARQIDRSVNIWPVRPRYHAEAHHQ